MKQRILFYLLAALGAAGTTHVVDSEFVYDGYIKPDDSTKYVMQALKIAIPFNGIKDWNRNHASDAGSKVQLGGMINDLHDAEPGDSNSNFLIPLGWSFDREDIDSIFNLAGDSINKLKIYSATKTYSGVTMMTLVAVGGRASDNADVLNTPDSTHSLIFEFADPCPPKCGDKSKSFVYNKGCQYKRVLVIGNEAAESCSEPYTRKSH